MKSSGDSSVGRALGERQTEGRVFDPRSPQ
ncbi:hypothetical protein CCACVL1_25104 [Corchorus capsularis]|uniref:Uncharacterized protein n=1 Tax=Corchorus capsularis TaxID=210143 RepID=A0A1R3GM20_COCAP|nr:hypothetical protein CCACVL1_25104 [Corchorus capsularis]